MHSGRDILKFNKYDDEPPRYPVDTSKIKTFEDAIIVLATVYDAINYTKMQLDGTNMRIEDYHQGDNGMTSKKNGMVGDENALDVYPVDSAKINTIEDVRLVIDAMELAFTEGFSSYEKLKQFLSDIPLGYRMH